MASCPVNAIGYLFSVRTAALCVLWLVGTVVLLVVAVLYLGVSAQ